MAFMKGGKFLDFGFWGVFVRGVEEVRGGGIV